MEILRSGLEGQEENILELLYTIYVTSIKYHISSMLSH